MTPSRQRGRIVAAASMILVCAAACGRSNTQPIDAGLQNDLAAAGKANTATTFTSALELDGSKPATAPVAQTHAPLRAPHKAVSHTPTQVSREQAAPQQAPTPVIAPPAPTVDVTPTAPAPTVQQPAPQAAPLPMPQAQQAPQQQPRHGPYKTEAQIFQQMPWIRP